MAKTLLLADGSATIQRVVDLTFAHEDIRVVAVPDGSRAIKWLDTERPDIVLVDVDLAEVDGYGIVTHLKQSKKLGGVPVLMLAGAFEPVDQDRARAIGCDGIVVKPFEPQHLVARVKELLAVAGGLGRSAGSREPAGRAPLYTGSSDSPSLAILRGASRPAEPERHRRRPCDGGLEPGADRPAPPAWRHRRRPRTAGSRQSLAGECILGPPRCGAIHSNRPACTDPGAGTHRRLGRRRRPPCPREDDRRPRPAAHRRDGGAVDPGRDSRRSSWKGSVGSGVLGVPRVPGFGLLGFDARVRGRSPSHRNPRNPRHPGTPEPLIECRQFPKNPSLKASKLAGCKPGRRSAPTASIARSRASASTPSIPPRRRSAGRCTSATCSLTRIPTSSPGFSGCAGATCSIRWGGTTTGCRPSVACRITLACGAIRRSRTTRPSSRHRNRANSPSRFRDRTSSSCASGSRPRTRRRSRRCGGDLACRSIGA